MKNILCALVSFVAITIFGSCGVNNSIILNHNQNATHVQLASNNFKVIQKVSGTADVEYVLMFGGMNKKRLFQNAYSIMVDQANLLDGSRALANIVTEEHLGGVPPFYYTRTITVSANVIEFIK